MYLLDSVSVLLRQWRVVLFGLALMSGAAWMAVGGVPTQYQASASAFLLVSPDATGSDTPSNPFLVLQASLTVTAELVAGIVTSPAVQEEMAADGFPSDYAIAVSADRTAPLLFVTANDTDPVAAVATVNEVIRRIDLELARIQQDAGAPTEQTIVSQTFSIGEKAEALGGSDTRALVAIAAVGVVATILAAFLAERLNMMRGQREPRRPPVEPTDSDRRIRSSADANGNGVATNRSTRESPGRLRQEDSVFALRTLSNKPNPSGQQ